MSLIKKNQFLKLSEFYFKAENYDMAKYYLSEVIKVDKNNSKANELMAYIYGNLGEIDICFEYLKIACNGNNSSADALYYLGSLQLKKGFYNEAILSFRKSISRGGEFFEVLHDLATAQSYIGETRLALENFQKCLNFNISSYLLFYNIARSFDELKNFNEAIKYYDKAINLKPDYPEAWLNKGVTLAELKRYKESIEHYDKAISLRPNYPEAWSNKGIVLNVLKQYKDAIAHYDRALNLNPNYAEALINKGITLARLKYFHEAINHYDKAISLKPNYPEAWFNKADALNQLKQYKKALICYDKALDLKPIYPEALIHKGNTLDDLHRYDEAIKNYDKALSISSKHAEAFVGKGVVFNNLKKYEEAVKQYEEALKINPDIEWLLGDLLHLKMKISSWLNFNKNVLNLKNKIIQDQKVTSPFPVLALFDDPYLHQRAARIFAKEEYPVNYDLEKISINQKNKNRKIRIGYFSADFRYHPVSLLTAELFELHDKEIFEIFAFSFGVDDKSDMRSRLINAFDEFFDVREMSDLEIAKLSRELSIDIAVDLGGYTADNRTSIFSYRAAPIQVSYIGYLGTMGNDYYDYLLADKTLIPENLRHYYSEKILYLPSYQVNDRKRPLPKKNLTKNDFGLSENNFVFCCFNDNYKILPATFDSWMNILKVVKDSILFLYANDPITKFNLIKEAEMRGVDGGRIIFGSRVNREEYLSRFQVCDLFLDTFPYNAGATASDALWSGLPIITLKGSSFPSRIASSILTALNLKELITSSKEEYEDLAVKLAFDNSKLANIKLKLKNNSKTSPLFDTPLFVKNIEAAFQNIYKEKF